MKTLGAILISTALAVSANAQATRTWVSGVGDDANPCSRTAPCKTFAGAISKTAPGGEIDALDPGGFGGVTITKSITLDGTGTLASILVSGTNGVIINAGTGDRVVFRNLQINGIGTGTNGINIIQAGTVDIDHVEIANFATNGVLIANTSNNIRVLVFDTTIHNGSNFGITSAPTGTGTVKLHIHSSQISKNTNSAVHLSGASQTSITNSTMSLNGGAGVFADTGTAAQNETNIKDSVLSLNQFGIFAGNSGGTPVIRIAGNQIVDNFGSGLNLNGGTVVSHGNNVVIGNGGNEVPSSTAAPAFR
jgi:hypothetical protein